MQVSKVPAHSVPQDDADPFARHVFGVVSGVFQGAVRCVHRQNLSRVQVGCHLGRNAPGPQIGLVVVDESADLAVGLVWSVRVLVVIDGRVPSLGRHFGDRGHLVGQVVVQGFHVRGAGKPGCHSNDCYRVLVIHVVSPSRFLVSSEPSDSTLLCSFRVDPIPGLRWR